MAEALVSLTAVRNRTAHVLRALEVAIDGGHTDLVATLMMALQAARQPADVSRCEVIALMAIINGDPVIMEMLLLMGDGLWDVSMTVSSEHIQYCRYLQSRQYVGPVGWTLLHYACAHGASAIARLLIRHGVPVDAESPTASAGEYWRRIHGPVVMPSTLTPLEIAAIFNRRDTAVLLIVAGASMAKHPSWAQALPAVNDQTATVSLIDTIKHLSPLAVATMFGAADDAQLAARSGRTAGWSRLNHRYHIAGLRAAVSTTLHVLATHNRDCSRIRWLPAELGEHLLSFLMRRHWEPPHV